MVRLLAKKQAQRLSMKIRKSLKLLPPLRLMFEFGGSRTCSMSGQGARGWLIVALFSFIVGCSSVPIAFQNNSHRQIYALNEENLKKVQFYISADVVAQYQDATGTKSLLVPRLTPGVVTSAGPDWLKVSFKEGGADVPFITDPNQYDGRYWIASEVEGSKDFKKVSELPGKVFLYKGTRYTLVSGADAILLFDWDGWKKVVETRKVTEGRRVDDK